MSGPEYYIRMAQKARAEKRDPRPLLQAALIAMMAEDDSVGTKAIRAESGDDLLTESGESLAREPSL